MDYVECVNLSMQTGVFFLLQCFWNYLSNSVAKRSFMGSWEFKFYISWLVFTNLMLYTACVLTLFFFFHRALGSVAVFPILQWYYRKDEYLRETAPQLAYSIEGKYSSMNLNRKSDTKYKQILLYSSHYGHFGYSFA